MSTFTLLLMLLFLLVLGIRFFMYCVDIEMPLISGLLTLILILMLLAELVLAVFELPAALIDLIVLICMGNRTIAVCCGVAIFMVLLFIFVTIAPKIDWQRVFSFSPIKYVILGVVIITLAIYTELFNGSYSFNDLKEYNSFKQSFAKYDRHFWPTKYIKRVEDNGRAIETTYSIYPWDVEIDDGKQFAYKVITFYSTDDETFSYHPFTYNLYGGADSLPVEHPAPGSRAASSQSGDSDVSDDG